MLKILLKCRIPRPHFYGSHCTLGRLMTVLVRTVTNVGKGNLYGILKVGHNNLLNPLSKHSKFFPRVYFKFVKTNLYSDRRHWKGFKAKELSLCHTLLFSNPNICVTQCRRPKILQTMNSTKLKYLILKYPRFEKRKFSPKFHIELSNLSIFKLGHI